MFWIVDFETYGEKDGAVVPNEWLSSSATDFDLYFYPTPQQTKNPGNLARKRVSPDNKWELYPIVKVWSFGKCFKSVTSLFSIDYRFLSDF